MKRYKIGPYAGATKLSVAASKRVEAFDSVGWML